MPLACFYHAVVSGICAVPFLSADWQPGININVRSDANYTGNTALSYIANKVRQGDQAGMVNVADVDGIQVLEMKQEMGIQNTSHGFTGTMEASGSCLRTHPASGALRTVWRF